WAILPFANRMLLVVAVCWLALFLGLRMRSTTQAIGYSLLWTVAVPAIGNYLPWFVLRPRVSTNLFNVAPLWFWMVQYLPTLLSIAYSLTVAMWARRRLLTRFRELAVCR